MNTYTITAIVKFQVEAMSEDHARELYAQMTGRQLGEAIVEDTIDDIEEG